MFHLLPVDLLQLCRCCKELREVLMSRRSTHLWVMARSNVFLPPPECPEDLSEPAYANLLFGNNCTVSSK